MADRKPYGDVVVGEERLLDECAEHDALDGQGQGPTHPVAERCDGAEGCEVTLPAFVGVDGDAAGFVGEHRGHLREEMALEERQGARDSPDRDGGPSTDGADGVSESEEQADRHVQGEDHAVTPGERADHGLAVGCRMGRFVAALWWPW